ncbi:hypothetical protein JXB41_02690 [Candidatus Woesearchaeota archaeon]|nr:hypothetical protein [Candidatus Woesearchaeota archaeon]
MNKARNFFILWAILLVMINACTKYEYTPYQQTSLTCPDGSVLECPPSGEEGAGEITGEVISGEEFIEEIPLEEETTGEEAEESIVEEEIVEEEEPEEELVGEVDEEIVEEEKETEEVEADIVVMEGDLVQLKPKVSDADGDEITLTYSEPLDENGEWQTQEGDAGLHTVTITASDGKSQVSKEIVILVKSGNSAPVIDIEDEISVEEGNIIVLEPEVSDADGDDITVTYSGWMTGAEYETDYEDAGEYIVTVTASDGKTETSKDVKIIVENTNRKPVLVLTNIEQAMLEITEGEKTVIETEVSDPDEDDVIIEFSEPFDENGEWQTEEGDAGEYEVEVTASDGMDDVTYEVLVVVMPVNHPPVFAEIGDLVINAGENLKNYIKPTPEDPEGEDVTIAYSGWVKNIDYVVKESDAGEHVLVIKYSDGINTVSQNVLITVNRPPKFEI